MPLYDAYGRPIRDAKANPETNQTPAAITKQTGAPARPPRAFSLKRLRRPRAILIEACTVLGFLLGCLIFRQEIVVEPCPSCDSSSDPFDQRFSIVNNGPLAIIDVHYACAVTHIETSNQLLTTASNGFIMVMVPSVAHLPELPWKQKTSTSCDFMARFGSELSEVRIEIEVFYRRSFFPSRLHGPGWKFTGKRGDGGKFNWDYASPDESIFSKDKRPLAFAPFRASVTQKVVRSVVLEDIAYLVSETGVKATNRFVVLGIL
jgi:hypothetical protein